MSDATLSEIMTITAARALDDSDVCFVGIGLPSEACNVARLTHAPNITLIYESGTIGTKPNVLPLSIGDGELCETAISTVSVPEMFRYWLQGGSVWQTENCCNNRCQCIGLQPLGNWCCSLDAVQQFSVDCAGTKCCHSHTIIPALKPCCMGHCHEGMFTHGISQPDCRSDWRSCIGQSVNHRI